MTVELAPDQRAEPTAVEIPALASLTAAVAEWTGRRRPRPLESWINRELDISGIPGRIAVSDWQACLNALADGRRQHTAEWPDAFDARIERFLRQYLRFARPDGTSVFTTQPSPDPGALLGYWSEALSDPALTAVIDAWYATARRGKSATFPPAVSSRDVPLAALRTDWSKAGDYCAIDHRRAGTETAIELCGAGAQWLGPTWTFASADPSTALARPAFAASDETADVVEWTFRVGGLRIVRTAVLLHGRRLAILADEVTGQTPVAGFRIALPPKVSATPAPEGNAWILNRERPRASARVYPIGLPPQSPSAGAEDGTLQVNDRALELQQKASGPRTWLPLLVSWDPARDRKAASWCPLTVTERTEICPAHVAVAYRFFWGRDESLLVYRSLARPAPRAFLGHPTQSRMLVGLFNRAGTVEPLVDVT